LSNRDSGSSSSGITIASAVALSVAEFYNVAWGSALGSIWIFAKNVNAKLPGRLVWEWTAWKASGVLKLYNVVSFNVPEGVDIRGRGRGRGVEKVKNPDTQVEVLVPFSTDVNEGFSSTCVREESLLRLSRTPARVQPTG
jgi:hypothetical protein